MCSTGEAMLGDLNETRVRGLLNGEIDVVVKECERGSTNVSARELYDRIKRPVLVATTWQIGGKGTRGRSFFGCRGGGLYMSFAADLGLERELMPLVTPAVAVAVAESIRAKTGVDAKIKWVNDVTVNDRKLCGILCETALDIDARAGAVVTGIGINLRHGDFPPEIKDKACALDEFCDELDASELCADVVNRCFAEFADIRDRRFLKRYAAMSSLLGREIVYSVGEEKVFAVAEGFDADAGLIIKTDGGEKRTLTCGDVSVRLKNSAVPSGETG